MKSARRPAGRSTSSTKELASLDAPRGGRARRYAREDVEQAHGVRVRVGAALGLVLLQEITLLAEHAEAAERRAHPAQPPALRALIGVRAHGLDIVERRGGDRTNSAHVPRGIRGVVVARHPSPCVCPSRF